MAANEERRYVARKLRNAANMPDGVVWKLVEKYLGLECDERFGGAIYTSESVRRLADLIEPESERTCHDFGGEEGTNGECYDFACSACGFMCDLPEPDFCPNCGAKVVAE